MSNTIVITLTDKDPTVQRLQRDIKELNGTLAQVRDAYMRLSSDQIVIEGERNKYYAENAKLREALQQIAELKLTYAGKAIRIARQALEEIKCKA